MVLAAFLATAAAGCTGARPVVMPPGAESGSAIAAPGAARDHPDLQHAEANLRGLVLASARNYLGATRLALEGRDFGTDCSGYVRAVFVPLGIDPVEDQARGSRTAMIHAWLKQRGGLLHNEAPAPGDLAFFHNTYDRNGDGRPNDEFTHVALVESIDPDGTVNLLHRDTRRVSRFRMNLERPGVARDGPEGPVLNSVLRRAGKGARHAPRLAGELFFAFGSPVRALLAGAAAPLS